VGLLAKFFGRTASEGAAFAFGTAAAPALRPIVQEIYNEAWSLYPARPLDPVLAAQAVAKGLLDEATGEAVARQSGFDATQFARMVRAFGEGPGVAIAFQLWRRSLITEAQFEQAAKREELDADFIAALKGARDVLLSPAELANARQQGFVDAGRQHGEAALQGITNERADIQYELSGLPPGIETGLTLWRRGVIDAATFAQIVREGHTKTKYTAVLEELKRVLLPPAVLVALHLKGWISDAEYHTRMELWGFTAADADDYYNSAGRPAAPVQMFQGWARGVDGPDGVPMNEAQFLKGIRESDIRPEWGPMLWGIRYAYPSLFQLRGAVRDGAITPARARTILRYERFEDQDADALVSSWVASTGTGPKGLTAAEVVAEYEGLYLTRAEAVAELQAMGYTAATADSKVEAAEARRAKSHRDAAIRAAERRFLAYRADDTTTRARLTDLQVPPEAQDLLMELWGWEREDKVRLLTPAQIKKAVGSNLMTRADAITELEHLGYDAASAATLLDE
jgi:hypothetical protein